MAGSNPRKRTPSSSSGASAAKRPRAGTSIAAGASRSKVRVKADPGGSANNTRSSNPPPSSASAPAADKGGDARLRDEFVRLFDDPAHSSGVSNAQLKSHFGDGTYLRLVNIINELTSRGRLTMSRVGDELLYSLVDEDVASKFAGLDVSARMVYQVIEKSGNMGIWTKDIRNQTNIQQLALNKIFKALESRCLIKPIKAVTAKAKKLYMLYDLTPAKEITGGPWYTELVFDHEFISELRTFILHCVRRLNGGKGVTLSEISDKMREANVSRVKLSLEEVQQLVQTLAFDYMIEHAGTNDEGEALFVAARRVTTMCEFKWWDVLCPDFPFRTIKFEDDVTLAAHEPHHHTA